MNPLDSICVTHEGLTHDHVPGTMYMKVELWVCTASIEWERWLVIWKAMICMACIWEGRMAYISDSFFDGYDVYHEVHFFFCWLST